MGKEEKGWLVKMYRPVAQAISETFGADCEVVLHDLTHPMTSVVDVQNGHVTGRTLGMPFNHLVSTVLRSKRLKDDVLSNYRFRTPDGKLVKSTTVLIRNEESVPVGALCINVSMERFLTSYQLMEEMIRVEDPGATEEQETELQDDNILNILDNIIERIIENSGPVATMDKNQKVEIVRFMEEKGVFLIKGAVDRVAKVLNVSRYSVYNYIDEVRGGNRPS